MARHDVMLKTPADKIDSANSYVAGLYGDPPGTDELGPLNAYVDGNDPTVATHNMSVSTLTQADTDSLVNFAAATEGCDTRTYAAGSGLDYWAEAFTAWSLLPVVSGIG